MKTNERYRKLIRTNKSDLALDVMRLSDLSSAYAECFSRLEAMFDRMLGEGDVPSLENIRRCEAILKEYLLD